MNELAQDEFKLNAELKSKVINTQYFQDLYRFFKLHPNKKEYPDIFKIHFDILGSKIFQIIFEDEKIIKNLAEFYFAQDNYEEALNLFIWLNRNESSFELLEKIGFCYQKSGDFNKAIESYKQAELFDKNKLWLQKKLGYCYRKTGEYQQAIDFYKGIIEREPKDLNNLAYLGQLHIDIEDFEEALKYYYKVEYQQPDNPKVFRPIGWCSFVLGKYDTAIKYFSKITASKPAKSDFLNIGHAYWASGKTDMALESYREAVKKSNGDEIWFRETFRKDGKYLKNTGIDDLDVTLMIDYVLMA
jgi:tetratricopeptide (TPR) repeat protein